MKKIIYKITKWFLNTAGRISPGVRLCLDEGLTSGKMIDYVYRNEPQGSFFGKWVDKQFLRNPGWEGVRNRRANLEILILEAIGSLHKQQKNAVLVDIASGPAAYILSVLEKVDSENTTAICRDRDERWLIEGRLAAEAKKIANIRFEPGDALQLSSLSCKPNIIVASGFYDWIVDDEIVKQSFADVFNALENGGTFILTNQTAHPNLDFVQSVFTDFNHKPLRMTMRSADSIEKWLEQSGFQIKQTLKDANGYYSVTAAWKAS